jgi:hypothetical protein
MQAALHEQLGLARSDELNRLLGGGLAMRDVDDLDASKIEREGFGDILDLLWTEESAVGPSSAAGAPLRTFHRDAQRPLQARAAFCRCYQAVYFSCCRGRDSGYHVHL